MILGPENRHLLLDALRPPPGARMDVAVGTSFTLDLLTLMTVPLAMAMYDRQQEDGSLLEDPVAALQALREYAGRITLFCQAGQIAVPAEYRRLLVYLEDTVYPVVAPKPGGIFHPKVWFIRYTDADDRTSYRLLCLTRNLSFSRSWDTVLRLEGEIGDTPESPDLADFVTSLIRLAAPMRALPAERVDAIHRLADDLVHVRWTLPAGFDRMRFIPIGHDGVAAWPFPERRRMLVISPYLTADAVQRLTRKTKASVLVSRPESMDALGAQAVGHLAERYVLASDAAMAEEGPEQAMTADEAVAEAAGHGLSGLHAKLYVADEGFRTRYWTGSANATGAAFSANVEFLVELRGRSRDCGIDTLIGETDNRSALNLRSLLESYTPPNAEPVPPDESEQVLQRLTEAARRFGALAYTATCTPLDQEDRWHVHLAGEAGPRRTLDRLPDDVAINIRPLTLGDGFARAPETTAGGLSVEFYVSADAVTPFFVVSFALGDQAYATLVTATLCNPPPDRAERVLSGILSNRADLIRFLLLLLGDTENALAAWSGSADMEDMSMPGGWLAALGSDALLEPLVRAFARDPQRLHEVDRVLAELARTTNGSEILPPGWTEIWEPIAAALAQEPKP